MMKNTICLLLFCILLVYGYGQNAELKNSLETKTGLFSELPNEHIRHEHISAHFDQQESQFVKASILRQVLSNNPNDETSPYTSIEILDTMTYYRYPTINVREPWFLEAYHYDEEGKLIQMDDWDFGTTTWYPHIQCLYTYDAADREVYTVHSLWENAAWCPYMSFEYEYDDVTGKLSRDTWLLGNVGTSNECDSILGTREQSIYVYDSITHLKIEEYFMEGTSTGNTWGSSKKREFVYDEEAQIEQEVLSEGWGGLTATWSPSERYRYTYTPEGWVDSAETAMWDDANVEWKNKRIVIYTYQLNGDYEEIRYMNWSHAGGWQDSARYMYAYNGNTQLIERTFDLWDADNGNWHTTQRWEYDYTLAGLILSEHHFQWEDTVWRDSELVYGYNFEGELVQEVLWINGAQEGRLLYAYTPHGNIAMVSEQRWANVEGWYGLMDIEYTYRTSSDVTDVEEAFEQRIELHAYPVPSSDYLNLELPSSRMEKFEISLVDIRGRVVKEYEGGIAGEVLNLEVMDVPSGIYWLYVKGDQGSVGSKRITIHK